MQKLSGNQIRRIWLDFFKEHGHMEIESKSLIPANDRSLLWVNSGVATLKDYFSGLEVPPNRRLTNSQKAIRTNDIENVGKTARHHTFFEMLGNFSIGDYFKKEAIAMAYELLVKRFGIPVEKLYVTVFKEDKDALELWKQQGISEDHLITGDKDTNFWDLGGGPCGPCTEIFYDRGLKYDPKGVGVKLLADNIENDRYVEIWNIVFSQFNNDGTGKLTELSQKNIDTGAGLERMAAVFQDAPTNFDTDLFMPIIEEVQKLTKHRYDPQLYFTPENDPRHALNKAFKVIADHVRAVTFAISDGAVPSNKERGYVIRRLIRRAALYGHRLGITGSFLGALVPAVVAVMHDYYPYLAKHASRVQDILEYEESKFNKTVATGLAMLEDLLKGGSALDAHQAFTLYDTYGFPIELTEEYVTDKGGKVDMAGFAKLLEEHQNISRFPKTGTGMAQQNEALLNLQAPSVFLYDQPFVKAEVVALFDEQQNPVAALDGQKGFVVLDQTVFYATSGGQEHDGGTINGVNVVKVQKAPRGQHLHLVEDGTFAIGDEVIARIDWQRRQLTAKNHTAEHVLHTVMKQVVDPSIKQEGSSKTAQRLTFDFIYHKRLEPGQIKAIEDAVAKIIAEQHPIEVVTTDLEHAKQMGALAYFGDTYEKIGKDKLRVIDIKGFGAELCGGTHLSNTADIEVFKIASLVSKGAASWRFECITSFHSLEAYYHELGVSAVQKLATALAKTLNKKALDDLSGQARKLVDQIGSQKGAGVEPLAAAASELAAKIETALAAEQAEQHKLLANELAKLFANDAVAGSRHAISNGEQTADLQLTEAVGSVRVWTAKDLPAKPLVDAMGAASRSRSGVQLVLNEADGRLQYYVACDQAMAKSDKSALNFVKKLSAQIEAKGGGRPELAQGGTKDLQAAPVIVAAFLAYFQ